ncbi:hypothetical protein QQ045_002459 [Rhodiola kirilowii]
MGKLNDLKPAMAMVLLQVVYAGLSLLSRLAFLEGLSVRVYIVYRQIVGTLVLAPIAYALKRRNGSRIKCGLTWTSFCWINLVALIGVTLNQNTYFEGLYLSTASTATATTNLIPSITFVIAVCLGMEKVNFKSMRSNAKIVGTLICIIGAVVIAFLRGSVLLNTSLKYSESWVFGCLLLIASACCWSLWLIIQVPITKCHSDHVSAAAWICLFSLLQSIVIALAAERDPSVWIVKSKMELVACIYSGVLASGLGFFLQAWCISIKGPVYSAMFDPLCTVITTFISYVFLSEKLYIGSLVGAVAVMVGLYIVLWAKAGDCELDNSSKIGITGGAQPSDDLEDPLLNITTDGDDHSQTFGN